MTVPLRLTIFQPYNWVAVLAVAALLAIAIWRMEPEQNLEPDPAITERILRENGELFGRMRG